MLTIKPCFVCHFFMIVLVYDQVFHMCYIMFTWSQFTCFIILVLLLLALPWGSNMFCASVSGYRYICSKFITVPMIHDRGSDIIREVLYNLYPCLCSFCDLYPCCFCKLLGLFSCICKLLWLVPCLCSLYALLYLLCSLVLLAKCFAFSLSTFTFVPK